LNIHCKNDNEMFLDQNGSDWLFSVKDRG